MPIDGKESEGRSRICSGHDAELDRCTESQLVARSWRAEEDRGLVKRFEERKKRRPDRLFRRSFGRSPGRHAFAKGSPDDSVCDSVAQADPKCSQRVFTGQLNAQQLLRSRTKISEDVAVKDERCG